MPKTGYILFCVNTMSMLYDWKTNTERRLKNLPNGVVITYPASAASALLPLTIANDWSECAVAFCGSSFTFRAKGD